MDAGDAAATEQVNSRGTGQTGGKAGADDAGAGKIDQRRRVRARRGREAERPV